MSLLRLLVEHPFGDDDPLVHTLDGSLTKSQVVALVEEEATRLGDEAGQLAPIVADGLDALVGMFACFRAGAVYVPINPRQPQAAVDETQRATAAIAPQPGAAFVLWTSGTTGRPKPVTHTHDGYLEIIDRVLASLRPDSKDRSTPPPPNLIPVSMALNPGIYNALFGLRAGAALVIMEGFNPSDFSTLVERHQIRSTVLAPAAMAMLSDDASIKTLAPLRYVRSITAPLSPFQARRFAARFGVIVLNGYGQAEIGEVIGWTAADAKQHPDKIGAVGRPHPGVEIRIDDPDSDRIGELLVKSPSTAVGLSPSRLTADGFVRTGDLARVDDDGFVWLEGRLGDLINRGGHKIYPEEVEEVLVATPGIREAAVVAAPDARLGQVPVAFVAGETNSDLEAVCRRHLVAYKVPVRFEWVDRLPRSETGKVLRRDLAARL